MIFIQSDLYYFNESIGFVRNQHDFNGIYKILIESARLFIESA